MQQRPRFHPPRHRDSLPVHGRSAKGPTFILFFAVKSFIIFIISKWIYKFLLQTDKWQLDWEIKIIKKKKTNDSYLNNDPWSLVAYITVKKLLESAQKQLISQIPSVSLSATVLYKYDVGVPLFKCTAGSRGAAALPQWWQCSTPKMHPKNI